MQYGIHASNRPCLVEGYLSLPCPGKRFWWGGPGSTTALRDRLVVKGGRPLVRRVGRRLCVKVMTNFLRRVTGVMFGNETNGTMFIYGLVLEVTLGRLPRGTGFLIHGLCTINVTSGRHESIWQVRALPNGNNNGRLLRFAAQHRLMPGTLTTNDLYLFCGTSLQRENGRGSLSP